MEQKQINLQKMVFIYNAVQSGWVVKKNQIILLNFVKPKVI